MKTAFADTLMVLHFLWVLFMIIGLPLGLILKSPVLRWTHFTGMVITAFFAASGMYCPLTVWEESLRRETDQTFNLDGGFLVHYISRILYPQIEPWILRSFSVLWAALTVLAMIIVKPIKKRGEGEWVGE